MNQHVQQDRKRGVAVKERPRLRFFLFHATSYKSSVVPLKALYSVQSLSGDGTAVSASSVSKGPHFTIFQRRRTPSIRW